MSSPIPRDENGPADLAGFDAPAHPQRQAPRLSDAALTGIEGGGTGSPLDARSGRACERRAEVKIVLGLAATAERRSRYG
jgi:hypothetical protein